MKKIIELSVLAVIIMALSGWITHVNVEQEISLFVKGVVHKFIPWINLDFNV